MSVLVLAGTLAVALASSSQAIPTVYTSRAQWLAAATGPRTCTNFENDAINFPGHTTPWTSADGFPMTHCNSPVTIQVINNGIINGSQEIHFRAFPPNQGVRFSSPGRRWPPTRSGSSGSSTRRP
jgi:hypothetical protein